MANDGLWVAMMMVHADDNDADDDYVYVENEGDDDGGDGDDAGDDNGDDDVRMVMTM